MFGRICCLEKRGWRVRLVREEILGLTLLRAEVPAPVLTDDGRWQAGEGRHPIRVCNYIFRDPIFGDLFAKLDKD